MSSSPLLNNSRLVCLAQDWFHSLPCWLGQFRKGSKRVRAGVKVGRTSRSSLAEGPCFPLQMAPGPLEHLLKRGVQQHLVKRASLSRATFPGCSAQPLTTWDSPSLFLDRFLSFFSFLRLILFFFERQLYREERQKDLLFAASLSKWPPCPAGRGSPVLDTNCNCPGGCWRVRRQQWRRGKGHSRVSSLSLPQASHQIVGPTVWV